jgi:hypothetical protein
VHFDHRLAPAHTYTRARTHTHTRTHTHKGKRYPKRQLKTRELGGAEGKRERESQNARCGRMLQDELEGHPRTNTTPKDEADKRREPEKLTISMPDYV